MRSFNRHKGSHPLLKAARGCLLLTIYLGSAALAFTQYRFDSWTTENGLPQNSVNDILQTRDGYLWLTTFGGLVRFDGLRFQVFTTGNTNGLRSGRFRGLFEDRAGNLWITTEGQGLTRYRDGVFTTYTTEDGLSSNDVWRTYEDSAGNLKAETTVGLTQWMDGSFKPVTRLPDEPPIWHFQPSTFGGFWYDEDGGMRKFENGRVTIDLKPGYFVNGFYEDRGGRLWMSSREERLLMYHHGQLKVFSEPESYPRFPHVRFLEDAKGSLWMGTGDVGLIELKDGKFRRYTTADGLAGNGIGQIYQDREGTLWVGSASGLSRITERVINGYSTKDGLAADNVYPILENREGEILIGSWNGLTRYSNGVFTDLSRAYGLSEVKVTSLLEDRTGGLWIGTWGWGIRYVKDGKVSVVEPGRNTGLAIRAMIEDREGSIWFGAYDYLLRYKDGQFTTYLTKDQVRGNDLFALHEDRNGVLWIGTNSGLSKYQDGVFTNYTEKEAPSSIVRAIYEDAEGTLWIGTYDSGLYRLRDGRFTHYTTNEGLFDNGAFSIIEDGNGNFWISCNLGVYRVRKVELNDLAEGRTKKITAVPYGKRDGMLNPECNGGSQPAGIRARDGRIWFPTQQGVAVIDPARVPVNTQPPPVVIESAVIDTKPVSISSGLKLQPGQVNLEINYTGLSFISAELIKFKYRLVGLDTDWVDAGTRRTAYYAHVPPGTYSFQVIAANRDGVWNQQGATIQVKVVPPFWRTRWFVAAAILTSAVLIAFVYRRRVSQLKRAHAAQEAFSRQLIESQEQERKRIAAELHDSLGQGLLIIKNRAAISRKLLADPAKTLEQIDQIEETAAESIKEVRQIAYALRPYQLDEVGLTQALKDLVTRINEVGSIQMKADIGYVDDLYTADAAINLYRIVQEALNNVVKHSGAKAAEVKVTRDERAVVVEIHDNGDGFSARKPESTDGSHRGFGLTGLQERASMLNGKVVIESSPGAGTSVRLHMEVKTARKGEREMGR